ncbi:hypothetical protein HF82_10085 [Limosilactobacillus reuteri]|nr:hypothetical protein [Limosilactobacillus reuteri]KEQ21499.1 hypothetical protein HF82_10085 [Limosilactobacillus reuteri]
MKNQKRNLVISTMFQQAGRVSAIALGCGVGFAFLVYLIGFIVSPHLQSFLVSLQGLPGLIPPILNFMLVAIFLVTPYMDFKWAIQNGISRKTLWQGRFLSMILMTLLVWFIAQLVGLMNAPFSFTAAWRSLLAYFSVVLTMMAIGNGFALLNRRWKWIIGIGLPVICFVLLMMLVYSMLGLLKSGLLSTLAASAFLQTILQSSITGWVILVIYLIVVYAFARFFNNKIQLRRD